MYSLNDYVELPRKMYWPYAYITALQMLEAAGAPLLGWEGWLRYPDGTLGHADKYQGTVDTVKA